MLFYAARRLLWIVPVLFVASIVTFLLMHAAPGSPWDRERQLDPALVAELNRRFGLDQPLPVQYATWISGVLQGDLGNSYDVGFLGNQKPRPVSELLGRAVVPSLQLLGLAFAVMLLLGVTLGMIGAWNRNRWPDHVATGVAMLGMVAPPFLVAVVLQVAFDTHSIHDPGLLPVRGWDTPANWVLPTIALAGLPMAMTARITRASMLDVLAEPYVRTAHSKGLGPQRVAFVHVLRNGMIPVMSVLGPILAVMITGSLVVESIFQIPGVGSLYLRSVRFRDYGVIMNMTLVYTVAIVGLNLLVDLAYGLVDPRIRESHA